MRNLQMGMDTKEGGRGSEAVPGVQVKKVEPGRFLKPPDRELFNEVIWPEYAGSTIELAVVSSYDWEESYEPVGADEEDAGR